MKISKWIGALLLVLSVNVWAAVDINTASVADLDSIKGIGPGTSAKILEQRKAGKFKDWADVIERVSGIGEARAGKLSNEGLTVNGEKFKAAVGAAGAASKPDGAKKAPANGAKPETKIDTKADPKAAAQPASK